MTLDDEKLFIGQALMVTFDGTNDPTAQVLQDIIVSDDDNRIQFNGVNRAPTSEAGVALRLC